MKAGRKPTMNRVFVDDKGVVHGVYHGAQTAERLSRMMKRIVVITDTLLRRNEPVRILMDIRDLRDYDIPSRLLEMKARTMLPFWKLAYVTNKEHPPAEQISRQLTKMSGRRSEIRYFEREDDAIGWLSFMR